MTLLSADACPDADLYCDLCVIGSGAAGIALALELSRRRIDTICISGGGLAEQLNDVDLYRGHILNPASHEPLEAMRNRVFGGSTTTWGGRLVPFDPIDFEQREFVPLSGWPISYGDMARHLPRAAALCEVPDYCCELEADKDPNDLPARVGDSIVTSRCERWSIPTNFAVRYGDDLRRSEHVRVLLHHHCVEIELDETHSYVCRIKLQVRGESPRWVRANTFVLACGGLENARLLLASRRQIPEGIGNQHGMVGRCYMGHVDGTHGRLRLNSRRLPKFFRLAKDENGLYVRRRLWLAEQTQRNRKLLNIIAFPMRPEPADPSHGDLLLSLLHLERTFKDHGRGQSAATVARHVSNVLFANPLAWPDAASQLWRRYKGSPRLPFMLPYRRKNLEAIYFQSEHAPNPNSRLVLSDQTDEFGMPRLQPQIAFTELDAETIVQFYAILDRSLRESGLGYVEYSEPELRDYIAHQMRNYASSAHHIGTTRLAADPREGVVDADSRVHGLENLYIAGSSIFPTSGHANPTLTLLALTLRLADHLVAAHRAAPALGALA